MSRSPPVMPIRSTMMRYDRARKLDRHPNYILAALHGLPHLTGRFSRPKPGRSPALPNGVR
jgi:hypothetical protein